MRYGSPHHCHSGLRSEMLMYDALSSSTREWRLAGQYLMLQHTPQRLGRALSYGGWMERARLRDCMGWGRLHDTY